MITETQQYILETLLSKIKSHNLKSGEIIISFQNIVKRNAEIKAIIIDFFLNNAIQTDPSPFDIKEIAEYEATNSMKYGLSTKPNYTSADIQFSEQDQNKIVHLFLQLFEKPCFYTINDAKVYKESLDLDDSWKCGGAIIIDEKSIGMLWTNDLYDKF
jgi:hypothetical protein